MTQRVNSLRNLNLYDYSNDIRPYILSSVNTNNVATIQTISTGFGGTSSGGGGGTFTGFGDIEELTLNKLIVEELEATNINSFEISTEFMSGFTIRAGNDVRFFGTDNQGFKKLYWDSSESNLYIDGGFQLKDPLIKIHNSSDNSNIPQEEYDTDIGVLFKYYDRNAIGSKFGFFGFDGVSHRFSIKESIQVVENKRIISDSSATSLPIANIEVNNLYVTGIYQIENADKTMLIQSQEGNDIDIVSGGDLNFYGENMNFNISNGYTLVNNNSNTSFINTNGDIELMTTSGDVSLDVDNGNVDILVTGDDTNQIIIQNTNGNIQILTGSTQNNSILIDTDGGVQIDISDNLSINTTNGNSLIFNSTNGLVSTVPKENFNEWISFYKFNSYSGFYLTERDINVVLGETLPKHYWKKEKNNETSIIFTDIEISNRITNQKGFKLKEIYFGYRVEDDNLNNIVARVTKKKFDIGVTGPNYYDLNVTTIQYNDINLNIGITKNYDYYGGIEITNPFFLNDSSIINIELEINTPQNSLFKFYGCNLIFDRNDL